jgi:hypothetical protein
VSERVAIPVQVSRAEYRALVAIAAKRGGQVHELIEDLVSRALSGPASKPVPRKRRRAGALSAEEQQLAEEIVALSLAGLNDRRISERMDLSYWFVRQVRIDAGLPAHSRSR